MNYDDLAPKYVLAVTPHSNDEPYYTYYALRSANKAEAFAEAATKSTKAKGVFSWTLLVRKGKATKGAAEYRKVVRFFPSMAEDPAEKCGFFDYDFSADLGAQIDEQRFGTLYASEIR